MRMTRQRKVILEELRKVRTHPTADQVYEMVRRRLPRISLATVYRNLDSLSQIRTIQTLELGGPQRRYDGNPTNHHHVRCLRCGRVDDVRMEALALLEDAAKGTDGYEVLEYRLEFQGICPECCERGEEVKAETEERLSDIA
ncbi:transcriptional repressor [Thermodesulfobacteriota bacterium]